MRVVVKRLAQELIGVRSLALGTPKAADAQMTRLIEQIDKETRKPEDKVRAAILVGYLQSKAIAQVRLDQIAESTDSPEVDKDIATLRTIFNDVAALQAEEANRLVRRYGYFGRMALAVDAPKNSNQRRAIETPAMRTLLVL